MKRGLFIVLVSLFVARASAYELIGEPGFRMQWDPAKMPVEYWVSGPESCPEDLPWDYCTVASIAAWQVWGTPSCSNLDSHYQGAPVDPVPDTSVSGLEILFGDPNGELEEPAVIAAMLCPPINIPLPAEPGPPLLWDHCDLVFNDLVDLATQHSVANGTCEGETNLSPVIVHQLGHMLGLSHPCWWGEECSDAERASVMTSVPEYCTSATPLSTDDIDGLRALFGNPIAIACSHSPQAENAETLALGVVPFTLRCESEGAENTVWTWGDGAQSVGARVEHRYEEVGAFRLRAELDSPLVGPEGPCTDSIERTVHACGIPVPSFEVEWVDGHRYQLFNETDLTVPGCATSIRWEVYTGDSLSGEPVITTSAWEPMVELPDGRTYTIVLNVGGPAGTGAASAVLEANQGKGCAAAPMGTGSLVWLPMVLLARRRDHAIRAGRVGVVNNPRHNATGR